MSKQTVTYKEIRESRTSGVQARDIFLKNAQVMKGGGGVPVTNRTTSLNGVTAHY